MKARISKSHLAAAILCIGLVTGAGAMVDGDGSPQRIPYRYTMEEGDTIYSVAADVATPKDDINYLSWKICQDNNIKDPGNIQPGTVITIRK